MIYEILGVLIIIGIVVFYMLPTVIAHLRNHESCSSVAILNVMFGWTVLGWLAVLIYACAGSQKVSQKE